MVLYHAVCHLRQPLATPVLLSQNADVILPGYNEFTGFVFKLQANLDPRHRDRLAYIRVVSGRFEKGMKVKKMVATSIGPFRNNFTKSSKSTSGFFPGRVLIFTRHDFIGSFFCFRFVF